MLKDAIRVANQIAKCVIVTLTVLKEATVTVTVVIVTA